MTSLDLERKTERSSRLHRFVFPILASLVGTLVVLFPSNPSNMTLPSRDSGVFLYMGWRLLMGDVPYRDVWDHKPPLIYFVDALGLSLTPDSLWGVWFLQGIFIFFTLLLIYRSLQMQFGLIAALVGTITMTSGVLSVIENGNVTEEYALVFQALCIWLFIGAWKNDFPRSTSFWIGLSGGLAFNSKQTTLGLWVVYTLVLIVIRLRQRKAPVTDLLSLFVGWLIPMLLFVAYLASQNALRDFWEQAFLYNFVYIGKHEGIRRLIPVFTKGFLLLSNGWVLYLAIAAWVAGLGYVWFARKDGFATARCALLIALIALPIEVLLITVSGRSIIHYYLTPMPVIAILVGTATYTIPALLEKIPEFVSPVVQRWSPVAVLLLVLIGQVGQMRNYPQLIRDMGQNDYATVVDYISHNTKQDDTVLLLGAESVVNFLARRESPTRYVYQYPLALTGRRPMFEEYFNQVLANEPVLLIDTRGQKRLTEKLYPSMQKRSEIVREGVQYWGAHYEKVAQFGEWIVYRKIESP
jgi:hypothetical protein